MPLLLLAGVEIGRIPYAAVATGAAFSVGFGAARDFRGRRWAAMGAATAGTTIAAFVGCLAGQWLPVMLVAAAAAAVTCPIVALIDEDLWWIVLQVVIALLIASYFAGPPRVALIRAGAVAAGGAIQMLVVVVLGGAVNLYSLARPSLSDRLRTPTTTRAIR